MPSDQLVARLVDRIGATEDGCWIYIGQLHHTGYGVIYERGESHAAHRVAFAAFVADIPDGANVRHLCARRSCVNPTHLEIRDVKRGPRKRTGQYGERHNRAKLTSEKVREIRRRCGGGETLISVARDLGVSAQAVSNVMRRLSWKHVR